MSLPPMYVQALRDNDYWDARKDNPEGVLCHFCGNENDFFDDIGFFFACPEGDEQSKPVCRSCWDSWVGKAHETRWGVSDR